MSETDPYFATKFTGSERPTYEQQTADLMNLQAQVSYELFATGASLAVVGSFCARDQSWQRYSVGLEFLDSQMSVPAVAMGFDQNNIPYPALRMAVITLDHRGQKADYDYYHVGRVNDQGDIMPARHVTQRVADVVYDAAGTIDGYRETRLPDLNYDLLTIARPMPPDQPLL